MARKHRSPGGKKFRREHIAGDSFTHDTQTWSTFTRDIKRDDNTYLEEIVLHDGTRIETRARLTDHPN